MDTEYREKNILDQIAEDPFVRSTWSLHLVKLGVLVITFIGVVIYVLAKCLIERM